MYNTAVNNCNENAMMVIQSQNYICWLENRGNNLLTKHVDKVNDLREEIKNLKSELKKEKFIDDFIDAYVNPIDKDFSMEFV